jgi:hypothetical protein
VCQISICSKCRLRTDRCEEGRLDSVISLERPVRGMSVVMGFISDSSCIMRNVSTIVWDALFPLLYEVNESRTAHDRERRECESTCIIGIMYTWNLKKSMKVQEYGLLNSSKKISQIGNGSLDLHTGCYETRESLIFVKL